MVKDWRAQALFIAAAAFGASTAACTTQDNETQITVAVTTETAIPEELDRLEILVTDGRGSLVNQQTNPVSAQSYFPLTLAIVPRNERSLEGPVQVELRGMRGNSEQVVLRKAIVSYSEGRTLLLPMPLRMACFHIDDCKADQTCAGGKCLPAVVEAMSLPSYDPKQVFPDTPGATCFEEDECLKDATWVDLLSEDACTFPLPTGDAKSVNVAIEWAAAPNRIIALDAEDKVEGWTVDTTGSTPVGKLSPGVCLALGQQGARNEALKVYVSTTCKAKLARQPICGAGIGHDFGSLPPP